MSYMPKNVRETVERNEMYARLQAQNKELVRSVLSVCVGVTIGGRPGRTLFRSPALAYGSIALGI
jgi:hypothetical protein